MSGFSRRRYFEDMSKVRKFYIRIQHRPKVGMPVHLASWPILFPTRVDAEHHMDQCFHFRRLFGRKMSASVESVMVDEYQIYFDGTLWRVRHDGTTISTHTFAHQAEEAYRRHRMRSSLLKRQEVPSESGYMGTEY